MLKPERVRISPTGPGGDLGSGVGVHDAQLHPRQRLPRRPQEVLARAVGSWSSWASRTMAPVVSVIP